MHCIATPSATCRILLRFLPLLNSDCCLLACSEFLHSKYLRWYLHSNPCFTNFDPLNSRFLLESADVRYEQFELNSGLKKFKFCVPSVFFKCSRKKFRRIVVPCSFDVQKISVASAYSARDVGLFKERWLKHNLSKPKTL